MPLNLGDQHWGSCMWNPSAFDCLWSGDGRTEPLLLMGSPNGLGLLRRSPSAVQRIRVPSPHTGGFLPLRGRSQGVYSSGGNLGATCRQSRRRGRPRSRRGLCLRFLPRGSAAAQRYPHRLRLQLPRPPLRADSQAHPGRSVRVGGLRGTGLRGGRATGAGESWAEPANGHDSRQPAAGRPSERWPRALSPCTLPECQAVTESGACHRTVLWKLLPWIKKKKNFRGGVFGKPGSWEVLWSF